MIHSPFVMWQRAITHMRVIFRCEIFIRGWIHIRICQTSLTTCE